MGERHDQALVNLAVTPSTHQHPLLGATALPPRCIPEPSGCSEAAALLSPCSLPEPSRRKCCGDIDEGSSLQQEERNDRLEGNQPKAAEADLKR